MGQPMPPVTDLMLIAFLFEQIDVKIDVFQGGGMKVEDEEFRPEELIPPDGGIVGTSEVPGRKDGEAAVNSERMNASLRFCAVKKLGEVRSRHSGIKGGVVLLEEEGHAVVVAVDGAEFIFDGLQLFFGVDAAINMPKRHGINSVRSLTFVGTHIIFA